MLSFFKSLFTREKALVIEIVHKDFGTMVFDSSCNYWETMESEIFHSMPGNNLSPNTKSIDFIKNKLNKIDEYWGICEEELLSIAHNWDSIDKAIFAKDLFKISAISVNSIDNIEWEICFETKPEHKWLYIGLNFHDEKIVENDIST